jgi:hypothetical protein
MEEETGQQDSRSLQWRKWLFAGFPFYHNQHFGIVWNWNHQITYHPKHHDTTLEQWLQKDMPTKKYTVKSVTGYRY